MKKNYTHIIILVDRSGSMYSIKDDMENGLKNFIEKQKEVKGKCTATAAQFDTSFDFIHNLKDLNEIKNIQIDPRGGTALIDSMVKLIDEAGKELKELSADKRPEKVLFLTITDGEENSSREFNNEQLKERIKHQEDKYNWEFVYIGANQDSFGVASSLGIRTGSTINYNATTTGINTMFLSLNSAATRYRSANVGTAFSYTQQEQEQSENAK